MTIQSHITSLESKHQALDTAIAEEEAHPAPDEIRLQALKKQKLSIKDEIAGCMKAA